MAGEYSRELSVKISDGQRRLASMGFWQGGEAPFGMARRIVDENGRPKEILSAGQWKSISTGRVVLVPGSPDADKTIRPAYDLYTKEHKSRHEIADILNSGRMLRGNQRWTLPMLQELLTNPVYKGAYAYGNTSRRLREGESGPQINGLCENMRFRPSFPKSSGMRPQLVCETKSNHWLMKRCLRRLGVYGNAKGS